MSNLWIVLIEDQCHKDNIDSERTLSNSITQLARKLLVCHKTSWIKILHHWTDLKFEISSNGNSINRCQSCELKVDIKEIIACPKLSEQTQITFFAQNMCDFIWQRSHPKWDFFFYSVLKMNQKYRRKRDLLINWIRMMPWSMGNSENWKNEIEDW